MNIGPPRTLLVELTVLPRPPSLIWGGEVRGKGGEEERWGTGEEGEMRGRGKGWLAETAGLDPPLPHMACQHASVITSAGRCNNYFRFRNTNVRHIGILLPVSISTIFP